MVDHVLTSNQPRLLDSPAFKTLQEVDEKAYAILFAPQSSLLTKGLQELENVVLGCYKAFYHAVQSHLFLPDDDHVLPAGRLNKIIKKSPRQFERCNQKSRMSYLNQIIFAMGEVDNETEEVYNSLIVTLNLELWYRALVANHLEFKKVWGDRFNDNRQKKTSKSISALRPALVESMNGFYKFLGAVQLFDPQPCYHDLQVIIDHHYKEQLTVCKRNATRRKNKRQKEEVEQALQLQDNAPVPHPPTDQPVETHEE